MMDLSTFNLTPSAKKAVKSSEFLAETFGHLKVIDLHLTLSILQFNHTNIDFVLFSNVIKSIEFALVGYKERKRKNKIYSPEIKEILESSAKIAHKFKDEFVGLDHILLSIFTVREDIADYLIQLGIDLEKINKDLRKVIKSGIPKDHMPAGPTQKVVPKESEDLSDWCVNFNQ